jgi:hypothetical protein
MAKQDIPPDDSQHKKQTKMTSVEFNTITEFYARVPEETREEFLKAILDKTFIKSLAGSNNTANQVDDEDSKSAACPTNGPSAQDFADYKALNMRHS